MLATESKSMSRSVLHKPHTGITTARSEKDWKRMMAKRARRLPLDSVPPKRSGDRNGPKDGKHRFNPAVHPDLMRK
jgi:hypothetical protein